MTETVDNILEKFSQDIEQEKTPIISFDEYLKLIQERPKQIFCNHFQFFHDVIKTNLIPLDDDNKDDPENIGFRTYDSNRLLVHGFDNPFFSDTLLDNKLMNLAKTMNRGSQQNKIYIFDGPHGCGKSTLIGNILQKCEETANSEEKRRWETLWCLHDKAKKKKIYVPCPSHDPPFLIIPKENRRQYFKMLFKHDPDFYHKLASYKEYEWVFKNRCCTICESIFAALSEKFHSTEQVFSALFARPYKFNRRISEGISVFHPSDITSKDPKIVNKKIEEELNSFFDGKDQIKYSHSRYAKTNYGIYVLMDIKKFNECRLEELHNITSEKTYKIDSTEEDINALFMAVINPEDNPNEADEEKKKKTILADKSFKDRVLQYKILYILNPEAETATYRTNYGPHIDEKFLPRVLNNFAKIIISTRMETELKSIKEWIKNSSKYKKYCDLDLILLRIEIYRAQIPRWLSEEDRKNFTAQIRRKIIDEASEVEGNKGCSGRDSIQLFYKFYNQYANLEKLINMSMLLKFFEKEHSELKDTAIPDKFLESLIKMYNYSVLEEVKKALFFFNEKQIAKDIQHYIWAILQTDTKTETFCPYTEEKFKVTDEFLAEIENRITGKVMPTSKRKDYRREMIMKLNLVDSQEMSGPEGKKLTETKFYKELYGKYAHNLKEEVLDPFVDSDNFRQAIKDYGTPEFETHTERIKQDVKRMITKLQEHAEYTEQGAKDICMYVIDEELVEEFS